MKESTDISFGNLQVDQERTVKGIGNADLKQTITGKLKEGTGYSVAKVNATSATVSDSLSAIVEIEKVTSANDTGVGYSVIHWWLDNFRLCRP